MITAAKAPGAGARLPGSTFVLPVPSTPLHLAGMLACDWRDGDVW